MSNWSRNITLAVAVTTNVQCPSCGGIHTIQQDLQPDDPEDSARIMEDPWFVRPCPDCQAELIYAFDITVKACARIYEERFAPEQPKRQLEPQQLDLF